MSNLQSESPEENLITPEVDGLLNAFLPKVLDGTMSLDELTQKAFKNSTLDGRNKEGRAVKKWVVDKGHKIKTSKYEKEGPFTLEPEQDAFIRQNIEIMRPMEICRLLWPSKKITPLNKEYLAVQNRIKELKPDAIPESEKAADGPYVPPKSIARLIPRINNYISKYKIDEAKPLPNDESQLQENELKNLRALLRYLNNHTFIYALNIYDLVQERELFESKFIRYTFDKPDLTEEEIDQYTTVCDKSVALHQIRRNIQVLQREINTNLETGDPEKKKVAMSFIELLNSYRAKETDAEDRLDKTVKSLVGTRETRLKGKLENNASVMNLVLAFQQVKRRKEMIQLAERQRQAEKAAVEEISNMDNVTALIAGLGKGQI